MKKSEVLEEIEYIIYDTVLDDNTYGGANYSANRILKKLEELGMQPPMQEVKLVEDTVRGGKRHSQGKHEWDKE